MPSYLSPDFFTGFGVVGGFVVFLGYALSWHGAQWLWIANFGLVMHWFGDSMDGTVARHRGIERPRFGFFLDQGIDVIINIVIAAGIGISPYARMDTALFALTGYQILGMLSALRNALSREFYVSMAGLGPTELRLMIFGLNIAIMVFGKGPELFGFADFSWCDDLLVLCFVVMFGIYFTSFFSYARILGREEREALAARRS